MAISSPRWLWPDEKRLIELWYEVGPELRRLVFALLEGIFDEADRKALIERLEEDGSWLVCGKLPRCKLCGDLVENDEEQVYSDSGIFHLDCFKDAETCENCGCICAEPHHDNSEDMVPLCDECWNGLLPELAVEPEPLPPCEFRDIEGGEIYCQHKDGIEGATPESECRECMEVD